MDSIEFVVARDELGMGAQECAEPVINGESLVDLIKRAERRPIGYAGLRPQELFDRLRGAPRFPLDFGPRIQVLRCCCGDDGCSWATVEVARQPDEVVMWRNVRASGAGPDAYSTIGPFRFAQTQYLEALAQPTRAERPVRDGSGPARLARGLPQDHRAWLEELNIETDPFTEESLPIALAGLRAFAEAGRPMEDATVIAWARDVGFIDWNVGLAVGVVRAARAQAAVNGEKEA